MDKLLDRPWFLRFTALSLAIILFISVQADEGNVNGKSVGDQLDMIYDIPVEVYYDDENLVVTGVPETVNITIEGPINIVQTTKLLKDFTIFVDLSTLTMGEHRVRIQNENISEKLQVRVDPTMIDVLIEEKITETFRIEPEMNRRLLAEGFNVVNMEVEPSTIEVTGAKSIVESISFVKATVSREAGINSSFEQEASIRILDRDLNKLNVSIYPENVMVKVEIAEHSKEVPITLKPKGTPPTGVTLDSLTSEQKVITLFGPSKVLEEIEEIIVDVDISKIAGSEVLTIDVKKPKGVSEISSAKIKVAVEATTEKQDDAELEDVAEENSLTEEKPIMETQRFEGIQVAVNGLDEQFKSIFVKPANGLLTVTVTAEAAIMKDLRKSSFSISVDASGVVTKGEQVYPVLVKGPENVSWIVSAEEVTMRIELA